MSKVYVLEIKEKSCLGENTKIEIFKKDKKIKKYLKDNKYKLIESFTTLHDSRIVEDKENRFFVQSKLYDYYFIDVKIYDYILK